MNQPAENYDNDDGMNSTEEGLLESSGLAESIALSGGDDEQVPSTDPAEGKGTGEPQPTGEPQQTQPSPTQTPEEQQATQQQQQPTAPARLKSDDKGNLVDADGKIVHTAGSERRLYENNQRLTQQNHQAGQQIQQLSQQLQQAQAVNEQVQTLNNMPQQLGLTPEDTVLGLQLIKSWRTDPKGTLDYILTEAKAMGHNIEGINGAQIDTAAVGRLIDQKMAPFTQDREQQQQAQHTQQVAERAYNEFITKYPDAKLHETVLADMISRDRSLTADAAYWRLQAWTTQQGLDFSQPLEPQFNARQQGVQQPTQTRPMVGGQAPTPQQQQQVQRPAMAPADADFEDIVRDAMQENGLNLNQ